MNNTANADDELFDDDGMRLVDSKFGAEFLSLSVYTYNALIREGHLGYVWINDHDRRVRLDQLHEFVADRTVPRKVTEATKRNRPAAIRPRTKR